MNPSRNTYIVSRIVAGIVSTVGILTIVSAIVFYVLITFFANPIQSAIYKGPASGILFWGMSAGFIILAFGLLCRAVFHIAQSVGARE
ncbi:hypothetical protein SAMN05216289_1605 [Dokdonella immobilis]|uniref:Uncharacterized protein n=1 Tax=Dokdonella immobilis TaxID=578942 RepID=A0A1I5BAN2_9GAMM|nr:hypothetical protein SAMN05216289_1605 [Dokdonella immobilis]